MAFLLPCGIAATFLFSGEFLGPISIFVGLAVLLCAFQAIPVRRIREAEAPDEEIAGLRLYSQGVWMFQVGGIAFIFVMLFAIHASWPAWFFDAMTLFLYIVGIVSAGWGLPLALRWYNKTRDRLLREKKLSTGKAKVVEWLGAGRVYWGLGVVLLLYLAFITDPIRYAFLNGFGSSLVPKPFSDAVDESISIKALAFFLLPFLPGLLTPGWIVYRMSPRFFAVAWWPLFLFTDLVLESLFGALGDSVLLGGSAVWTGTLSGWGWTISTLNTDLIPGQDAYDLAPTVNLFGNLGILGVAYWAIAWLHRDIVERTGKSRVANALSIHPEARTYIDGSDKQETYRGRVRRLIQNSTGGVVGITGVRGAGKSALLGTVQRDFGKSYCVVWTVAPVRHGDASDLSYLMSICRSLCRKAIADAEDVIHGAKGDAQVAFAEFFRKLRMPVVLFALALAFLSSLGVFLGPIDSNTRTLLPPPDRILYIEDDGEVKPGSLALAFTDAIDVEERMIAELIPRLEAAIEETSDDKNARFAILPNFSSGGFTVARGTPEGLSSIELDEALAFGGIEIRVDEASEPFRAFSETLSGDGVSVIESNMRSRFPKHRFGFFSFERHYGFLTGEVAGRYGRVSNPGRFLSLQNGRNALTRSNRALRDLTASSVVYGLAADALVMETLRDYPNIAEVLIGNTRRLADAIRTPGEGILPADWPSLVLLDLYVDVALRLRRAGDQDAARRFALEPLFLDREALIETKAALGDYLATLRGEIPDVSRDLMENVGDEEAFWTVPFLNNVPDHLGPTINILALALLFVIAPEVIRLANFLLRAAVNFRLLILLRESERFLEELSYSDAKSYGASFGFSWGLNLRGSRSLSARAMTLQSLTDRYQAYVKTLLPYYNGKLILIIDELDKMTDPNDVRNVLLQLKGALFQKGCYYLLSLSQDCAKAFRGRLVEGRDIFESTFEDILDIGSIEPTTARSMVRARLQRNYSSDHDGEPSARKVTIDDATIDVMTAFSGGIPREIVRMLRNAVLRSEVRQDGSIVVDEASKVALGILTSDVESWRASLVDAPFSGSKILAIRGLCDKALSILGEGDPVPSASDFQELDGVLRRATDLVDPKKMRLVQPIVSAVGRDAPEKLDELRVQAEVQAILRLRVLAALTRLVVENGSLSESELSSAIEVVGGISGQPVISEAWLDGLTWG